MRKVLNFGLIPFAVISKVTFPSFFTFSMLFLISFFPNLAKAQNNQPAFLKTGESLKKVINGNIFVVENETKTKKRNRNCRTITKLYFTDGKGMVVKTFDVFPFDSSFKNLDLMEDCKNYHSLYRRYEKNNKEVNDVVLVGKNGDLLWTSTNDGQRVFWDSENKRVFEIYPNEGIFKVIGSTGSVISETKFTSNSYKRSKSESGEGDEFFSFDSKISEDGNIVALSRRSPQKYNELFLMKTNGNVLFKKEDQLIAMSPVLIDEEDQVLLVLETKTGSKDTFNKTYVGYHFSGTKLWELNGQNYHLDRKSREGNYLKVLRVLRRKGEFHLSDLQEKVDLKTGKIISE